MQKYVREIKIQNQTISYTLRVSKRAKRVRLTIYKGEGLTVTVPRLSVADQAEKFIWQKSTWILSKLQSKSSTLPTTPDSYKENKDQALKLVLERIEHFNKFYNFKYGKISIRNQRTRWGSCSRKGNLNFSYKIALIPQEQADYIIVHELCHLKEFNHSQNFWDLIALQIPNHKKTKEAAENGRVIELNHL
jgi:predicted metal-dependent hydrolase